MRSQGKITHWNTEKGYGFITPSAGAKQVFVHISSFGSRTPPRGRPTSSLPRLAPDVYRLRP